MPRSMLEWVALVAVGAVATTTGVAAGVGAVPGPNLLCITPFGTASAGSGCDPQHVSATLAIVAGALSAIVAGMLALAVAATVLHHAGRDRISANGG